jgi:peptidoglycan/LPS O-acetylase OafA/YrhL
MLVMIMSSIATGWVLYALVETPFMRLRARYAPVNHA